jgi:hypothetical protein
MGNATLQEAIKSILLECENLTASTSAISAEIERKRLYSRKDGKAARANQINARVRHHPAWFELVTPGVVRFIGTR